MILNILTTDGLAETDKQAPQGVRRYAIEDLSRMALLRPIVDKYEREDPDKLRWSLKSVFISFLLGEGYDKVIFTDPDTWYCSDYAFLFQELDNYNVILTPHWRNHNPTVDKLNFDLLFVGGLFNAGFFGANAKAIPVLDWWATACLDSCDKSFGKGKFVDQSYLNLMPLYFDDIGIIRHRGCNVANWNQLECRRTQSADGTVLINDKWPIVFIHFTASTIQGIERGKDSLLAGYLQSYRESIARHGGRMPDINRNSTRSERNSLAFRIMRRVRRLF